MILILQKLVPLCITFFFKFLTYRNVQQLFQKILSLVRRNLDQ